MAEETLTELRLKTLKPLHDETGNGGRRYEVFDAKIPGFAVRVSPTGTKTFVLFYRQQGKQRRLTLGRYPVLSLAEARREAYAALNKVTQGIDPQRGKDERRKSYRFDEAVETFLDMHCQRRNRDNTIAQAANTLRQHYATKWEHRDVREIKRADVLKVLDRLMQERKPAAANRSLAVIRKFFNWCAERGLIDDNPCSGLKTPASQKSRDRVLEEQELRVVWRAAAEIGYPFGAIVQLLILTGQRRNEVAAMRWSEIDLDGATWSLPADRTKNDRPHVVPLSSAALQLLAGLPNFGEGFVFPAQGNCGRPFSGFSKSKHRLEIRSETSDWTLHDLRRTVATGMAKLGVAPHVVERILNHTTGTLGGVAGVYNRFGYLPEMRAALDQWAAYVAAVQNGT